MPEGIGNRDGPLAQFIGATYAVDCNLAAGFAATNISEVVLIGTHGGELVIASGVPYLLAGKNFVIWSVMACVEAPPASDSRNTFVTHKASAWAPTERPLWVQH